LLMRGFKNIFKKFRKMIGIFVSIWYTLVIKIRNSVMMLFFIMLKIRF